MKRLFWILLIALIVTVFCVMGYALQDAPFREWLLSALGGTGSAIYLALESGLATVANGLNSLHPWTSHIAIIPVTVVLVYVTRWAWTKRASIRKAVPTTTGVPGFTPQTAPAAPEPAPLYVAPPPVQPQPERPQE